MWTITLRLEIQDSNNNTLKVIHCDNWKGGKADPFYVAYTATEIFNLNRNNILSIVKKKINENNAKDY